MPSLRHISYPLGSIAAGTILNVANTTTFLTPATIAVMGADGSTVPGLPSNGIPVQAAEFIDFDMNISAISGASAALTVTIDRYGEDGVWYNIYNSGAKSSTGVTSTSIGVGASTNVEIGNIVRVAFFLSNTTTPSVTLSASVRAKS